jgi:ribosomal protein S18 acetylase RimI-like enzyme
LQSPTSTTTPEWSLRPAREDDREFSRGLHEFSYRPHVERIWGWDDEQQAGFFERRFRPEKLQIVQVAGLAVGVLEIEERADELFLANVEIHPDWRGKGVGSSIIRSLQERAREAKTPLTLQVLHVNRRARTLYDRLGFEEVGRDEIRARMRWRHADDVASSR